MFGFPPASWLPIDLVFSHCVIQLDANGLVGQPCSPVMIRLTVSPLIGLKESGLNILALARSLTLQPLNRTGLEYLAFMFSLHDLTPPITRDQT